MLDTTTFVGLDVHARSIKAVSLDVMTGEVRCATFGYDAGAVAEWVRSVDPKAKCVYESGVTGFDLQKRLSGLGVDCVVGAVSKMIKPSADRRRKNDRNDAEFLARMLSVGNVVEVWVPDDECEAARDLTRALEDARDDLSRSKQRLSKFLLRHERPQGRDHQGGQQAPEEGAGRGRVALPDVLGAAEGPRQGPGPGPGRPQACRQGRAEAGREAGGAARARGPRQQGERGHGARARLLGVGGRPHGRGGVGGCSYSFVNWAMLFSRLNRDMLTPGLSADGLQSVRSASTRRRRAPCPA